MRCILLEDNKRSGTLLCDRLTRSGYIVDLATNVTEFREYTATTAHDIYLIDLGLPDGDGLDVIRELRRSRGRSAPILIVSARSKVEDKVVGLDSDADDYLCKPFHIDELLARVRALLRRPANIRSKSVKVGSLILNCATGDILYNGQRVELRPSERQLLALLIRRSGRIVPKSLIADSLRTIDQELTPNSIEKMVSRLRKCLSRDTMGVELQTIRGDGYVLKEFDQRLAIMQ